MIEREKNLAVTRGFPYPTLQEAVSVVEDQTCLILVLDTGTAATVRTVPQSGAKTFERAGLNGSRYAYRVPTRTDHCHRPRL